MSSSDLQWVLVNVAAYALPVVLTVAVPLLGWPRGRVARSALAIVIAWFVSVLFTAKIYNPVGEAYLSATRGAEYAFNRFDNNTIAVMILSGWFLPLLTVLIFFGGSWTWRRFRMRTERAGERMLDEI